MSNGTKNKLSDLNNLMFEMLEKLSDDELMRRDGEMMVKRAKAMTDVGGKIIDSGKLALDAQKHADEYGYGYGDWADRRMPNLLETKTIDED